MQPRKLKIENFGPFVYEVIDFSVFYEAGLFLISGKTGAGKTTIFDAMTYALFGKTSGQLREGKEMRSTFAQPEEPTKVTFLFEYQERLYEITRSPEYERPRKKGTGTVVEKMSVTLTLYDLNYKEQRQWTKTRDVEEEIANLLRLTADQFLQIMLLPQGEFRRFLIANSNEKEKLLRQLFDTVFYQDLNQWLKSQRKEKNQALKEQEQRMQMIIEQFQWFEEEKQAPTYREVLSNWEFDLQQAKKASNQFALKITALKNEKEQLDAKYILMKQQQEWQVEKQTLLQIKQELDEHTGNHEANKIRLTQLEWLKGQQPLRKLIAEQKEQIQKRQQALAILFEKEKQLQQEEIQVKSEVGKLEKLHEKVKENEQRVQRCQEMLPKAEQLTILKSKLAQIQSDLTDFSEEKKQLEQQLIEVKQEKVANEQIFEKEGQLETWRQIRQQAEKDEIIWQQIATELQKLEDEEQEYLRKEQKMQQQLLNKNQLFETFLLSYKQLKSDYAKLQIARLQLDLLPGEPCPVCGSCNHEVAAVTFDYSSQQQLDFEEQMIAAEKEYTGQLEEIARDTEQIKFFKEQLSRVEKAKAAVKEKQMTLQQAYKEQYQLKKTISLSEWIAERIKEEHVLKEALELAKEQRQKLQKKLERIEEKKESLMQSQLVLNGKFKETQAHIDLLSEQVGNLSFEQLLQEKEQADTEGILVSQEIEAIQRFEQSYQANAQRVQQEIVSLSARQKEQQSELDEQVIQFQQACLKIALNETQVSELQKQLEHFSTLQAEVVAYQNEWHRVHVRLKELEEIPEITTQEVEVLIEKRQALEDEKNELQKRETQLLERTRQNQLLYDTLMQQYHENQEAFEAFKQLQQLSEVINGENKEKLSLERYLMQVFLIQILEVANQRLARLTKNRYQFLIEDKKGSYRSSTGLEIQIYDDHTGQCRRAQTLSGGESFIAALALSLSMADVIQQKSGGIAIEALFIDEGFGSLDEEALETAIEALETIENEGRLIGVISHVREMKERIRQQLVVKTKGNGQSQIETILVS